MNLKLLFALVALSINFNTLSQENSDLSKLIPKSFISQIEIIAGPGFSYWSSKESLLDQVSNLTFSGGLGFSHSINKKVDLHGKLLFERKGNKFEYVSTFYDTNGNSQTSRFVQGNKLDYITASVAPKFFLDKGNKLNLGIGCYVGYLLQAITYTKEYSLQGNLLSYYEADVSAYKKSDFGLSLNMGYKFPMSSKILFNIQLLHNVGLLNIVNGSLPGLDKSTLKNNITSLLIGVTLNYNRYERYNKFEKEK